ncbi:MAG TPA: helix-turn-helix transcriptional regulator [Thermoanaerobaculia bacterium]|nr:helix-turn-helix transcriptional regulator [Thermoanaerobaculia bacterium]
MFQNLGKTLLFLREFRGMSQAQLARAAKVGKSQLSKYESGRELPKLDSIAKILTALGTSTLDLFTTLHFVNQRVAALSGSPSEEDGLVLVWASGGLSPLATATEESFAKVFRELLSLHQGVVRHVLLGQAEAVEAKTGRSLGEASLAPTLSFPASEDLPVESRDLQGHFPERETGHEEGHEETRAREGDLAES